VLASSTEDGHLAMDTLAIQLAIPLSGYASDFHLLGAQPKTPSRCRRKGSMI